GLLGYPGCSCSARRIEKHLHTAGLRGRDGASRCTQPRQPRPCPDYIPGHRGVNPEPRPGSQEARRAAAQSLRRASRVHLRASR
ncbi:unnamed protein product, partial [Ectocarpus sp. 12 AP-2014]